MSWLEWLAWFGAWLWLWWDNCRLDDRVIELERAAGLPPRKRLVMYGRETAGDGSVWPWVGVLEDHNEQWFTITWCGVFVTVYIGACKQPD